MASRYADGSGLEEYYTAYFLTHTYSNNIYLNRINGSGFSKSRGYKSISEYYTYDLSKIDLNNLSWLNDISKEIDPSFYKTFYQGYVTKDNGYIFNFDPYLPEVPKSGKFEVFKINTNDKKTRCYASQEYWKEMYINKPELKLEETNMSIAQNIHNNLKEKKIIKSNNKSQKSQTVKVENKKNSQINEKKSQEQTTKVVTVKKNNLDKKSLKEELKYWKELFEEELITKAEYDQKRKELLEGGVQETKVITTKVEEPKKEVVKKIIKPKIDMSYKNKNYLYPKIDKKFNAWSTEKIINRCMSDFRKTLEAIMCMQKNIRATNRYKKGGRGYMDLYNLHITASGNVEDAFLNGHISESEGKTYLVTLNSQIINALNVREAQLDSNKPNGDALIQLGQEMMKPGFDWSTGKATNNSQSNSSSFYSCVLKAPLSGIGSGLKGSSIGTIECN